MSGINTIFQVIHDASGKDIVVSVVVDPAVGTAQEDQYHAALAHAITSDQVFSWDQFQLLNKGSRDWLIRKVGRVIDKEIKKEQEKLSDALVNISKGVPKKPESAAKRALTKALAIGIILTDR